MNTMPFIDPAKPENIMLQGTLLWEHLYEKYTSKNYPEAAPSYKITLPIPKTDAESIAKIVNAEQIVFELNKTTQPGWDRIKFDQFQNRVLKDGDATDDPNTQGCWVVNASSQRKPYLFDQQGNRLDNNDLADPDHEVFYSGCKIQAGIRIAASHGRLCAFIQGVSKVADGERIAGSSISAEDFGLPTLPTDPFINPAPAVTAAPIPAQVAQPVANAIPAAVVQQPAAAVQQPAAAVQQPVAAVVQQPAAAVVQQPVAAVVQQPVAAVAQQPVVAQPAAAPVNTGYIAPVPAGSENPPISNPFRG
jgi:hypothetical protein